jgi:hypothetical protein
MTYPNQEDISELAFTSFSTDGAPQSFSAASFQFPIGSRVVIHGLQHNNALNEHLAVVEEFLTEQERFKVRPLGRQAKLLSNRKFVAIRAANLKRAPPSAFLARIQSYKGTTLKVPLVCRVELDTEDQLAVRLLYDDFLGVEAVTNVVSEIEGDQQTWTGDGDVVFGVVTTPIHQEFLREIELKGNEVLILQEKPAIRDLYDAMVQYELLEEIETTVDAGLHGSVPLSRLRFPFQVEQT